MLSPVALSIYEAVREPELLKDPLSQSPSGDLLNHMVNDFNNGRSLLEMITI
jgi:hypothetical protein